MEYTTTFKMHIITDDKYILEREVKGVSEYFYCKPMGENKRTIFIKAKIYEERLVFDREDFYKEMTFKELNNLECRILGL